METLVDRAVDLAGPMPLPTPFGLMQLVVRVLLLTVFAFYVQEIVALIHSGLANLPAILQALQAAGVTVWSVWDGDALAGIGALKQLDSGAARAKLQALIAATNK